MKNLNVFLFAILVAVVTIGSCKKEEPEPNPCENVVCLKNGVCVDGTCDCSYGYSGTRCEVVVDEDIVKIEQYLIDNNLIAEKTESGLHYIITQEGTGIKPINTSIVEVRYKGYFLDNRVFDETTGNETISFNLNEMIKGWIEGLQYFRKGGKGTLLIPSVLAYGSNPPQGIPINEVLIFDIELVDVR